MRTRIAMLLVATIPVFAGSLRAEGPSAVAVREAMRRGLVRVEAAARNYPEHRDCFSCHHQTLPVVAMNAAEAAGEAVDEELIAETVAFSAESFANKVESLRDGSGIGGRSMTVGYALWAFGEVDRPSDELSEAMVAFLLKDQQRDGNWRGGTKRPPMEVSKEMATALAVAGLERYAPPLYRRFADRAVERARDWLVAAEPTDQEDRAARLWALRRLDADPEVIADARLAVLDAQRPDGGWAQADAMGSDAYATGQALTILARTGTPTDDPAYRRGLDFLLRTQVDDGSWFVPTRSRPIQTFFDNGDPHGESQFISVAATCWAVTALAESLAD